MKHEDIDRTVSSSKEESIKKAMELLEESGTFCDTPKAKRPDINRAKTILAFLLPPILTALSIVAIFLLGQAFSLPIWARILAALLTLSVSMFLFAKTVIKSAILLYQRYAPERLRASCLFTPSCSEYMLLAIDKYGTLRGVCKGLKRLSKCHAPNGGVDYP